MYTHPAIMSAVTILRFLMRDGGNKKTKSRSIESHVDLLLLERRKDLLAIEKKKKVTTKMILILHETTCEDAGQSHPIPIAVHVLCLCH